MLKSFKNKKLAECWQKGKCKDVLPALKRRVLMKLESMDAASAIEDLRSPPGNQLHQLMGEYQGYWAIAVSGPWATSF